jgi:glutaredoxin-dependent peroxiredoxin
VCQKSLIFKMVEVGEKAPDVELIDTDRKPMKISDLKGKTAVVAFFPAAFTGVCTKEMCTFRDDFSKFENLNSSVVAISADSPFSNKSFKEQQKLNFPVLSDYNRTAIKAFGVELPNFANMAGYTAAKRSVFVLDKNGTVAWKWVSDNPGVEPNYNDVRSAVERTKN